MRALVARVNMLRRAAPAIAAAAEAAARVRSEARVHVSVLLSECVDVLLAALLTLTT